MRIAPIPEEASLPADHEQRMARLRVSLEGLAIGDAFGEMMFHRPSAAPKMCDPANLPPAPWFHTDDTEMALGIAEVLRRQGSIDSHILAQRFADRFREEPLRGYGPKAKDILNSILDGQDWRELSFGAFHGTGSKGNGGAMRAAPLGAYFAEDDEARIVEQAKRSSLPTHTHPEGIAGAIAIALATAAAWRTRQLPRKRAAPVLFERVLQHTPPGATTDRVEIAAHLSTDLPTEEVVAKLGNGAMITAEDTVAYCLWCAARDFDSYEDAIIHTVMGEGDTDTNAAIVGGIVALHAGLESIPQEWREHKELYILHD